MATTIVTKSGSGAPTASDLVAGELAVDLTNKRLYTEDSGDTVIEVGSNPYNFTANHDGSAKLATTATGIDVTGIVQATGGNFTGQVQFNGTAGVQLDNGAQSHTWVLDDNFTSRFNIGTSSAGATWKFGSNNNAYLAVSPSGIDVTGSVTADGLVTQATANTYPASAAQIKSLAGDISYITNVGGDFLISNSSTTDQFVLTSAGSVGIGTSSPAQQLHLSGTGAVKQRYTRDANSTDISLASNGMFNADNLAATGFGWYNNGLEAMRIDASGNLLVGTASGSGVSAPDNSATASDAGVRISGDGYIGVGIDSNPAMYLNLMGSDGEILQLKKDGVSVGSIGTTGSNVVIGTGNTGLRFYDGGSAIIPHTAAGGSSNGLVDLGQGGFNEFKDLHLSGGVYLGGTGAANQLDDYEEGTFTPTFVNIGTGTYSIQVGSYIKIGKNCTCHIYLQLATLGTASGLIVIGGLPFSAENVANHYASTSAIHGSSWTTATAGLQGLLAPNQTQVTLYEGMVATGSYATAMADIGTGNLLFSITYTTA
jgi:hypothetical protein